jgi:hypothetical protein
MTTLHENVTGDTQGSGGNSIETAQDALIRAIDDAATVPDVFGPADNDSAMRLIMPGIDAEARRRDDGSGKERRIHRRHDLEHQGIDVDRWDGRGRAGKPFGRIVDISAGGVRIRAGATTVKADQQIRLRVELPDYAGISPFVELSGGNLKPKREWVGWMSVCRVAKSPSGEAEIAGRLVDMNEMDRGMLSLYLSTQPLAA